MFAALHDTATVCRIVNTVCLHATAINKLNLHTSSELVATEYSRDCKFGDDFDGATFLRTEFGAACWTD